MKKFFFKLILFSLPIIFIIFSYFILDPFKVIYSYDSFYDRSVAGCVFLNKDYVSTTNFDNYYDTLKYNSFIFGNSRTLVYQTSEWKKYIGNESCYHFDASDEALYAIQKKIKYLNEKKVKIKNVLLILDHRTLIKDNPKSGHLGIISPQLEAKSNFFNFHLASIRAFLNIKFLFVYFDFKISGKVKSYMKKGFLIEDRPFEYDYISNEVRFDQYEDLIIKNEFYTKERMRVFYNRDTIWNNLSNSDFN